MTDRKRTGDEESMGRAYDSRLVRRLWQFCRPHWRLLILGFLLVPVTVGFELAQPYLLKIAIDNFIAARQLDGLGTLAIGYVALVLGQAAASYGELYALQLLGQRAMHDLRLAIYRHVLSLRMAFFDRSPVGRLLTRMTNDVESINEVFANGVITLIADIIKMLAIVVMMVSLDARLTLMTFVTLPALFLVVAYARRIMRFSYRAIRVKVAAMNAFVQEHVSGIKVVQLFGREEQEAADYDQLNSEHRDAYLGAIRADAAMYAVVEAIGVCSAASIAWYSGSRIGSSGLTVGLIVAFIEYINKFFIPVRYFSSKYTVMQSAMAASERVIMLLDTDEPDAPSRTEAVTDPPLAAATPAVELHDVHFAYRPSEPILRGLDLTIERGQTVAIVGPTGSGKSTILRLLGRLYEPQSGSILLDGRDIRSFGPDSLRRKVTVVSQDVFLFSGSIADNVRLGDRKATDEQVRQALERVGAAPLLRARGHDIHAQVSELGHNFSAGERQLIAFARALIRNPDLLILDEATAHIDPEVEATIETALAELMKGRTTLIVAHRLSTIRRADRIVILSRGVVAESGTHDELMAADGLYARLDATFRSR